MSISRIRKLRDERLKRLDQRPLMPQTRKKLKAQIRETAKKNIKKYKQKQSDINNRRKKQITEKYNKKIKRIRSKGKINKKERIQKLKDEKKQALENQKHKYNEIIKPISRIKTRTMKNSSFVYLGLFEFIVKYKINNSDLIRYFKQYILLPYSSEKDLNRKSGSPLYPASLSTWNRLFLSWAKKSGYTIELEPNAKSMINEIESLDKQTDLYTSREEQESGFFYASERLKTKQMKIVFYELIEIRENQDVKDVRQ